MKRVIDKISNSIMGFSIVFFSLHSNVAIRKNSDQIERPPSNELVEGNVEIQLDGSIDQIILDDTNRPEGISVYSETFLNLYDMNSLNRYDLDKVINIENYNPVLFFSGEINHNGEISVFYTPTNEEIASTFVAQIIGSEGRVADLRGGNVIINIGENDFDSKDLRVDLGSNRFSILNQSGDIVEFRIFLLNVNEEDLNNDLNVVNEG